MKRLLTLLLLFSLCLAKAQQPALLSIEGIGGNHHDGLDKHVVLTDDGGFILKILSITFTTGNIANCNTFPNSNQTLFRKYDVSGTVVEWDRCYQPATSQTDTYTYYLFPASNGNFYTIGSYGVVGSWPRFFLSLEDVSQNKIWNGPGYGEAQNLYLQTACRATDGGFFLAFSSDYAQGDVSLHYGSNSWSDIWLLKLDSLGNQVWNKTIGGTGVDMPTRVLAAPDGGCYVAGYTDSYDYDCTGNNGTMDAYLARIDSSGNVIWHKCLGGTAHDVANDACLNGNDGVLICGYARSSDGYAQENHSSPTYADFFIVSLDTGGNVVWTKCFGGTDSEYANAITSSSDGSIWVTGLSIQKSLQVDTAYGLGDSWTIHIDASGNFMSGKVLGAGYQDEGRLVHTLPGDLMFVGGEYRAPGPPGGEFLSTFFTGFGTDIFLARFAPWTTGIETADNRENPLTIYPNPAEDRVYIKTDGKPLQIKVLDLLGNKVFESNHPGGEGIDVSNWARGVYYLYTRSDKGPAMCTKLLLP